MNNLTDLNAFRKRKSNARVFQALEALYAEVLDQLRDERNEIHPEELEEFLIQVLVDHMTGHLESTADIAHLNDHYRRFDTRLRRCLHTRIQSLQRFQSLKG